MSLVAQIRQVGQGDGAEVVLKFKYTRRMPRLGHHRIDGSMWRDGTDGPPQSMDVEFDGQAREGGSRVIGYTNVSTVS